MTNVLCGGEKRVSFARHDYLYTNLKNVLSRHPVDLELLENDNLRMLYKRAVTSSSPPPTEASTLLLASNSTEIPIPVTKSTIELKKQSTKQLPTVMITDIRKKLRINETTPKSDATSPLPIVGNVTLEPSFNNNNNYTEDDLNDREELFPSDIDTESGEKQFNETLAHHNITRSRTDKFEYYNSSFHNDPALGHYYWVDMDNRSDVKINELLSHSHRRAATVKLSFEFPFYGHFVKNITIATGGFLYTGDYVHSWLAATQYIAPLMANFDTSLSTDNFIKHVDNGTAFTVEWQKVSLQEKPNEKFTFQVTLLKNGDIIFVYKNISISVKDIQDDNHPVKVGLSDAYILDRTIFWIFGYWKPQGNNSTSTTMGGSKHSCECDSDSSISNKDYLLKRLSKLKRKLKKYKRSKRRRSRSRSSSYSSNDGQYSRRKYQARPPYNRGSLERPERDYRSPSGYESRRTSADHTPQRSNSQGRSRSRSASSTQRDDPEDNKENVFELHSALSSRWSHIITKGLSKEARDELWKKYPFPSNCPALTPPQINPEVTNILPQFHIKRDKSHLDMQARLSRSMSAIGTGINVILNDKGAIPKEQKEKLLCYLGDSAKILADLAYHSSQLRRTLILPQMDKSVREMAETTSPGIYLFGDDFGGKVKELKAMEKTSKRKFKQEAPGPSAEGGEATEGLLLKTKPQQPIPEQPLKVTTNPIILSWIKGYKIPFSNTPPEFTTNLPILSEKETSARDLVISELISSGAVSKCKPHRGQFVSSSFLRDKSNGKKRFILNLKRLNTHVDTPHFKMDDYRTVSKLMAKGSYMTTIDLKDAYFLIPIAKEHRKFLRFEHRGHMFEFSCLPFGLSSAPYCFTKLLKPVMELLRSEAISCVNYLDDFILFGDTADQCDKHTKFAIRLLTRLGFNFDSQQQRLNLPNEKRLMILKQTHALQVEPFCKIRDLARVLGLLVSACPAVRYGWLYTKTLERDKYLALQKSNANYDAKMQISSLGKSDLNWWEKNILTTYNTIQTDSYDIEIFTDSSLTGWGAVCQGQSTHGWWTTLDKKEHINVLELRAIFYGLRCFVGKTNTNVLVRTDNTTALSYINRMGSVQHTHLNTLARKIWQWCEKREIRVFASYISSSDNWMADKESRTLSTDTEWSLSHHYFDKIVEKFGCPDIDIFATSINTKCERYISWKRDPYAITTDAFTVCWNKEYFYAFPPFALVLRSIQKIINEKAEGILVSSTSPMEGTYPGGRKIVGEAFKLKGVPEIAIETIMNSLSEATLKQYNSTFKAWWHHCIKNRIPLFTATVPQIIVFLQTILNTQQCKYGTLNSHRSALSLILEDHIGTDGRLNRFMKGVSKIRPSRPKYSNTWDPGTLVAYFNKQGSNENLTLQQLSYKLVSMLAITTVIRRKTIFEYHRVDFAEKDIKNWTVIYLKALPTCLHNLDCHTCLTRKVFSSSKGCIWCPTLNKCSDGFDRHRQHWTANECDKKGFKNETMCSQSNKTIESLFNQYNVPDVEFDSAKASQVYLNRNTNKQQDDVGVSGIIAILFLVAMVSGLAIWVFYAYRNPHTTSGQILIRDLLSIDQVSGDGEEVKQDTQLLQYICDILENNV
ncbi:hypothetical protein NQ317_002221 [Molorchus minor]|uniref:Reverse transcriptase domain-containing protein n=1 Tax=Molorchus minor TaxID=1323400 RepID=A0ABQ9JPM2_9CUCU|nr:hypothetical protein NQ317_002221 [Molorchus minor]